MSREVDLKKLMRAHQADIWRFLRVMGAPRDVADDITQEVFLTALERGFEERSEPATLVFLRTIAKNRYLMLLRRERHPATPVNMDTVEDDWAAFAGDDGASERVELLRECLHGIDERERLALDMRYRDSASRGEIAQALQLSEGGTKNLLERAKSTLRRCVERKLGS